MEDKQLIRIRMKDWWNDMKKHGHWKQYRTYEEWEKRNDSIKEKQYVG